MVRHYQAKIEAFPGARKGREFYRDVLALAICGYSATDIALTIGIPLQTVNRALKRIRWSFSVSIDLWVVLASAWEDIDPRHVAFFMDALNGIYSLDVSKERHTDIHHFRWCVQECPRGLGSQEFVTRFVEEFPLCPSRREGIPSETFPFRLPQTKHASALDAYFKRKKSCRFCPLEGAQDEIVDLYWRSHSTYVSMKWHLSQVRIRQGVFEHLAFALVRGMIAEYLLSLVGHLRRAGLDGDAFDEAFIKKFDWVVEMCWDAMAKIDEKV